MKGLLLALGFALSACAGCATCREHPAACAGAVTAELIGGAISSMADHGHAAASPPAYLHPICTAGPC